MTSNANPRRRWSSARLIALVLALGGMVSVQATLPAAGRADSARPASARQPVPPAQGLGNVCHLGPIVIGPDRLTSGEGLCSPNARSLPGRISDAAVKVDNAPTDDGFQSTATSLAAGRGPWHQIPQTTPPPRHSGVAAYHEASGQLVLFGGCCGSFEELSDTWVWKGSRWAQLHPAVSPPGREGATLVYDAARKQIVLFGGYDFFAGPLSDTWTWNGATWTQQHPATSPSGRLHASMAYDTVNRQTVLFGGNDLDGDFTDDNQTWTWNGTSWTEQHPITSPPPRSAATMSKDVARGNIVLFGGTTPFGTLNDTWTWDGTNWSLRPSPVSPPSRVQASMAYDATRSEVVLFGGANEEGRLADTWTWNGTTWTRELPATSPPRRQAAVMAYSPAAKRVVLFAGHPFADDTWTWDGTTWRQIPRRWPYAVYATATYDPVRQRTILFQPACRDLDGQQCFGDTWLWNGTSWTEHAASPPPELAYNSLAFDLPRGQAVLFGGRNSSGYSAGTWTWDGSRWRQRQPTASPPARAFATMAYDRQTRKVLLFGGATYTTLEGLTLFNDTWVWNGVTWAQLRPAQSPPARFGASMAFDAVTGQLVLFGGGTCPKGGNCTGLGDTWTWNGTTWTRRQPAASPSARQFAAFGYDAATRRPVLFGGTTCPPSAACNVNNDTWTWTGTSWSRLDPGAADPIHSSPGRPSGRTLAAVAQTPAGKLAIVGGGEAGRLVNDMWVLSP